MLRVERAWRYRAGGLYRPRNPRASALWQCARRHGAELREAGRLRRAVEGQVIERFIECGDPHHGFARIPCDECGHDYLLAFSCRTRHFRVSGGARSRGVKNAPRRLPEKHAP
jgi:hypothetical protein